MAWYARALNLLRPNRVSRDIDREMSFHMAERADDLATSGMSRQEAEREAARRFGHRSGLHERTRDADMLPWLESFVGDLKQAARVLRGSPAFTFVAVFSLALGIGANTAIFSLLNAVMLKSLPVSNAGELVTVSSAGFGSELSNPLWESFRDKQHVLASAAAFGRTSFNLSDGGEARTASASWVSGDYFNTLGVTAAAGRLVTPSDDVRGCPPVAVLSYGFWKSEFGGNRSVMGSAIRLDKQPFTIVGVTPPAFFGAEIGRNPQVYVPLCSMAAIGRGDVLDEKQGWFLSVIGRLKPQQTAARAEQELSPITEAVLGDAIIPRQFAEARKDLARNTFLLKPGVGDLSPVRQQYSQALIVLMAVAGVVLFIGCANVANLLLARAAARQREIAVRFALGASRARVIRQLLTETLLLATLGAALGVLFARWSASLLLGLLGTGRELVALDVSMDGRVLLFTVVVASCTAMLFGLAPAWRSTRTNPQEAMRANSRGIATGHSRFSVAKALVTGQVALSLVLVVGAGLLLGTFRTLATLDLGFSTENVLLVSAGFGDDLDDDVQHTLPLHFLQRMRAIPGVLSTSASGGTPVSGSAWNGGIAVPGYLPVQPRDALVFFTEVTGDYFATIRNPILHGRSFDNRDQFASQKVAVISHATAKKFFGESNAVGKRFNIPSRDSAGPSYEVIGVVADSKYGTVKEVPKTLVFLPITQRRSLMGGWNYELRTTGNTRAVISQVTALAKQINPRIMLSYRTLEGQVAASIARERVLATLSAFFGALALLLAMIGLYGTMSYSVQRRRNEIGVRLALGAARGNVLRMVLGEVARVLAVGLLIGVAGALASSRYVASFLFGVTPNDVRTLAWSVATLASVALVAGALPAWRAARMDPMLALREE